MEILLFQHSQMIFSSNQMDGVVNNNLVELFPLLPLIYPQDFADFLLQNYFRFLDEIFHK